MYGWVERSRTFFSLSFSVFSSLLAFAAWRLSCFAVNCCRGLLVEAQGNEKTYAQSRCIRSVNHAAEKAGTISAEGTCLEVEKGFLEARHDELSVRRIFADGSRYSRRDVSSWSLS